MLLKAISLWKMIQRSSHSVRTTLSDLCNCSQSKSVLVYGWIKSIRKHKKVTFLEINDGSTPQNMQVVLPHENFPISSFIYGSAIGIQGELIQRAGKIPKVELLGSKLLFHSPCESSYPFASEWNYPNEFVRKFPHLRPRQKQVASMFRVRNKTEMLLHKYFQSKNFTHIHTPAITSSDCEGAGELFSVTTKQDKGDKENDEGQFFGSQAHLTVSGQLHLEACALGLGDVYTLSPAFRAEKSRPQTHLCEFHMLEIEIAFTQSLTDIKCVLEDSLRYTLTEIINSCEKDLSMFYQDENMHEKFDILKKCASEPYLCLEYGEAVDLINSNIQSIKTGPIRWGDDLNDEHEKFLTKHHNNTPVYVQNFPASLKPFYALSNGDKTCASFDLLFPNCGELAGGTMREHRWEILEKKLEDLGITDMYTWYLQLRQFGGIPHGGYGLGFDRLIKFILGLNNIRDAVPFPRAPKLCML